MKYCALALAIYGVCVMVFWYVPLTLAVRALELSPNFRSLSFNVYKLATHKAISH
jgi:hypothetical protein